MKKLFVMLLTLTLVLSLAACAKPAQETPQGGNQGTQGTTDVTTHPGPLQLMGTGKNEFPFSVTDLDGKTAYFLIRTDREIVGEALQELGLLEGEEGPYGLYVMTVNGITLKWETHKAYWAFYVNGQYGATGVDQTIIEAGVDYAFVASKE